jgi:hypothetical protein
VAVLTRVVLLASFAVVVAVSVVVVGSVTVYELVSGVISSVSAAAVITALGGGVAKVAVFAFAVVCFLTRGA